MIAACDLFRDQPLVGECPANLAGLSRDSRAVQAGQAYVALADDAALAERHVHEAAERGAGVVIAGAKLEARNPKLETPHERWSFARASAALTGADRLTIPVLGVTGTKGKSTVVHFLQAALGADAARIGTIGWHDGRGERPNAQTTPPPEELHRFLAALPPSCPGVAIEVSSHGCDQFRLAGVRLAGLAYTGLGHDHLDYHGSQTAYLAAKLRAVQLLHPGGLLVVNADDDHAHVFAHAGTCVGARVIRLGLRRGEVKLQRDGDRWLLAGHHLPVALPGTFNAWNAAAGALLAAVAGSDLPTCLARLATAGPVPGRLERLAEQPITYVDYAHTPESIANVITAVRDAHPGARVAIVFGCGGDRDTTKRAPMGAAAAAADLVVITTDNSRSEDPAAIAGMIASGIGADRAHLSIPDRAAAIRHARQHIGPAGVVIVAGKGHETSQTIGGQTLAWDDRAFVASLACAGSDQP